MDENKNRKTKTSRKANRGIALTEVSLMIMTIFAFAFILSQTQVASASAPAAGFMVGMKGFLGGAGHFGAAGGVAGATNVGTLFGWTLLRSSVYGLIGYLVGKLIGSLFGLSPELTNTISTTMMVAGIIAPALQAIVAAHAAGLASAASFAATPFVAAAATPLMGEVASSAAISATANAAGAAAAGGATAAGATTTATAAATAAGATGAQAAAMGAAAGPAAANSVAAAGMSQAAFMGVMIVIGIAIIAITFILTYKEVKYTNIIINCEPWEAPTGGANSCEKCNGDLLKPCSEYRCKSLGLACELLNKGTTQEMCAYVGRNDVKAATITPLQEALKPTGLVYTNTDTLPPSKGVKITTASGGCLKAYTPLEFGIQLDKLAQCKISANHTTNFDAMEFYFGESNFYAYNHTQKMRLPNADAFTSANSPVIRNDGTADLYVRCKDANGNINAAEYAIEFCVDKSPDTTPPVVEGSSIPSGSFVQFGVDNIVLDLYVNEPANCKWSRADKSYENMENTIWCNTNPTTINANLNYLCGVALTGVEDRASNDYYIRCEDLANNTMQQSYNLILKGTQPLNILSVLPNGTLFGSTSAVSVNLGVQTDDGAEEGKAVCLFSDTGVEGSYTEMLETNSFTHKQNLQLPTGDYNYYYRCIDAGGNSANETTRFSVFVDNAPPFVTRAYKEEPSTLKIVTNEDATCAYSTTTCNFLFADGTPMTNQPSLGDKFHFVAWKANEVYHIKCRDKYGNEPSPNDCSIIAGVSLLS
jgi:hypothetical protein